METARRVAVKVLWNGKNVTEKVQKYASAITYTDREEGASDELSITFDNSSGVWFEDWYPDEGDTLQVSMGYEDQMIDCGLFQVDEVTVSGPPDIIEVKALAAGISKALRTRNNKAFESMTLRQIAMYFCNKHELKLVEHTSLKLSQINMDRKTQENKTDLAFLSELAKEYGFLFSIRGNQLVFVDYYTLDNAVSVYTLDKTDVSTYSLTNKTYDTYAAAEIRKRDPKKGTIVKNVYEDYNNKKIVDIQILGGKAGNVQQAEMKVKAGIWNKNKFKESGTLNAAGNPLLVAGQNFDLTGLGLASGKYHVVSSTHTVSGGSTYTTDLEVRKTGTIPKPKRVPKAQQPKSTETQDLKDEMEFNSAE